MLNRATPIFAVTDLLDTLRWYEDALGFKTNWTWGEPPSLGCASLGQVAIMFGLQPELAAKVEGHQLWVDVDQVDALYADHLKRGAEILDPIEDKPWGRREYTVRDPNGYHLRFAAQPAHVSQGRQPYPAGVEILTRLPTAAELKWVTAAAFGQPTGPETLHHAWNGVVALDPDGSPIGVLRIMFDSPGWFSIWDVTVVPDWQGRRVGSAMMKAALEVIHEVSPGANVYLFTFKDGFYERLGFSKESLHMRRV